MLAHQKNYDITERYLIKSSLPKHCVKPYLFLFGSGGGGGVNYYISFLHISVYVLSENRNKDWDIWFRKAETSLPQVP